MTTRRSARTDISVVAGLERVFRRQGLMVPTSPEDAVLAQHRIDLAAVSLPARLNLPPALEAPARGVRPNRSGFWTNHSVRLLNTDDPVREIIRKARRIVLSAIERGWAGPPYDPGDLAELMNISLVPTEDVIDARTKSERGRFRIEFNPMRPAARLRFSIAHEIGHTFFPDCAELVRHRATHEAMTSDEWQLEMLCNVAASEILMPIGSLPDPHKFIPTVDAVLDCRRRFLASSEAVLLRLLQLTSTS